MPRIEIHLPDDESDLSVSLIRRVARTVIRGEAWPWQRDLSIIFTDADTIQDLNSRFLGHDRVTDVMAFRLDDDDTNLWGEVYVCVNQARVQSEMYHVPLLHELTRLVIHGVLHLMDLDDGDPDARAEMTRKEDRYLAEMVPIRLTSPNQHETA